VRVYYEFALSESAQAAGTELALMPPLQALAPGTQRLKLELGRAERLFGAKQYAVARRAFEALRSVATGDDRELVNLRVAECDYFLKRIREARDGVRPYTERASRQGEALYFYAIASRDLGSDADYLRTLRRIVDDFPEQTWAEDALNNLATYYILRDLDDEADATFRELYQKYPKSSHAERAAWKAGWRAYRAGRYRETTAYFDRAAVDFPRSDHRPAWLYWSGRAHDQAGDRAAADQRYAIATADYLNSYYGRLAAQRIAERATGERAVAVPAGAGATVADAEDGPPTKATPLPPNAPVVRALLSAQLYDDALTELRYAQKVWGDSAAIQATIAWVQQQQARTETGTRRFQLLRGAINTMRRAYPQFMAAGGEELPREVLTVIYPLAYWDLIRKHASANGLDPYLVAALVAQESTFVADIRSHANAHGLMQLLPSTARQYARKLRLTYSSRLLSDPESNIRMGTAYLADKIREFGDLHLVLASYNAGETPVRRWLSERPGVERDEFIDDIPYPETQMYIKRILGTADDYRRLYGGPNARVESLEPAPGAKERIATPARKAPSRKAPAKKPAGRKRPPTSRNPG
jgi:soluble lytic murein transglycosylase